MRILLVDDSNSIAMVVGNMLEELGFMFERAKDGQDAVRILSADKDFDLILLDWNMPNMDGEGFLRYNKTNNLYSIPTVMMTTESKPEKIMLALELGAVEYIMKPFTPDILIAKINLVTSHAA